MYMNEDVRAALQYQAMTENPEERLKTLKVHRQAAYQGTQILFVSYEQDGVPKHDIEAFERDAKSGFWFKRSKSGPDRVFGELLLNGKRIAVTCEDP
jgi:hypothetical protein